MASTVRLTGDADADALLSADPLALLIGMLLDQQIPMERAFEGPRRLAERLGVERLDAAAIADHDPEAFQALFAETPAIHRFPGSMATRVQDVCRAIVESYDGDVTRVWEEAADGRDLRTRLKDLPGFGDQKARIFLALLAKRLGVTPDGWQEAAGEYGDEGYRSVADIADPSTDIERVREWKQARKAEAKAKKA
jgi:uncharacterized HhH-GPD family protein